jgi:hypothetical protein
MKDEDESTDAQEQLEDSRSLWKMALFKRRLCSLLLKGQKSKLYEDLNAFFWFV